MQQVGDFNTGSYFASRFTFEERRAKIWKILCNHYFQKLFDKDDSVLDLAAGWCHFINNINVREKFAVDLWPDIKQHANTDVFTIISDASSYPQIHDKSINKVFVSNFFEHLNRKELDNAIEEIKRVLVVNGQLIVVQPNFRTSYKRYFDDYTHQSIWTDVSLCDYLQTKGFSVVKSQGRFLPFSVNSRLPSSEFLIRLYLKSPIKPFSGQMLILATKNG